MHAEDDVLLAYVPAAQIEQVAEAVPLYLPVLQSEQVPEAVPLYLPEAHDEQDVEAVPLYWPVLQLEQTEDSSPVAPLLMCFPAGQLQMERSDNSSGGCVS